MSRKILTLDIETSPALCYSFETRNTYISPIQIVQPTRVIAFAAKWVDDKNVQFWSEYHNTHEEMVRAAHKLLTEADVVVTYNGNNFDLPHLGREFKLLGLKPPQPYTSVDLYRVIKKNERWMSHKLAYITEQLELSGKMDNSGWALWLGCLNEEEPDLQRKSWNIMRRYNKQDVVVTEELFYESLPYINNMPSAALWSEEKDERPSCPVCGSHHVTRQGYKRTAKRRYPQYQCQECGKWLSDTRSDLGVTSG